MDCIRFLKSERFWVLKNNLTSRVRIKVPGLYQTEERANSKKKKKEILVKIMKALFCNHGKINDALTC